MNQSKLFSVLDTVSVKVAEAELERLRRDLADEQVVTKVRHALTELEKLQHSECPDYNDPWVALCYLTWFHPGHIRLSRHLFNQLAEGKGSAPLDQEQGRQLHVVDFGCGTLATLFGLTWCIAEALEAGSTVYPVRVSCFDTSAPMLDLGVKLWQQFKREVKEEPSLTLVVEATESLLKPNRLHDLTTLKENPQEVYLLAALHTVYKIDSDMTGCQSNVVKESLNNIFENLEPAYGLLTCRCHPIPISLLRDVTPFNSTDYFAEYDVVNLPSNETLPGITGWRQHINEEFSIDHGYLVGDVKWECRPAYALRYTRG